MDNESFHKDNDYIVTAFDSDEGLKIFFPERIIKPCFDKCWYIYTILNMDENIITKFRQDTKNSANFSIPEYASRVLIYLDIVLECHTRKIHTSLINCYSNKEYKGGLNALINLLEKPKEMEKENLLFNMVDDILHSRERKKTKDKELEQTFDTLINFIMQGSFKV